MTPGERYCSTILVRIVGPNFVAGMLIDRETRKAVVTAPILGFLRGQHEDKLRQTFRRLGWKATIVNRGA